MLQKLLCSWWFYILIWFYGFLRRFQWISLQTLSCVCISLLLQSISCEGECFFLFSLLFSFSSTNRSLNFLPLLLCGWYYGIYSAGSTNCTHISLAGAIFIIIFYCECLARIAQSIFRNSWMSRPICMRTTVNMISNQAANTNKWASLERQRKLAHDALEFEGNRCWTAREKGKDSEQWGKWRWRVKMKNPDAKILCHHKQTHSLHKKLLAFSGLYELIKHFCYNWFSSMLRLSIK